MTLRCLPAIQEETLSKCKSNPLYHNTLKTHTPKKMFYSTSSAGNWKLSLPPRNHVLSPIQMTAPRIGPAQFMLAAVAGMTVGRQREKTQYQPHANASHGGQHELGRSDSRSRHLYWAEYMVPGWQR